MNPLEKRSRKSQLKTLKDLEKKYSVNRTGCDGDEEIDMNVWEWNNKLRDAAREWYYSLKKINTKDAIVEYYNANKDIDEEHLELLARGIHMHVGWIRHFFNLEDDE